MYLVIKNGSIKKLYNIMQYIYVDLIYEEKYELINLEI